MYSPVFHTHYMVFQTRIIRLFTHAFRGVLYTHSQVIHTCNFRSFTCILHKHSQAFYTYILRLFTHAFSGHSHAFSNNSHILRLFSHAFSGHSHAFYRNILKPFTHTFSDYSHTHSQVIHTHSQIIHTCILMSLNVSDLSFGTLFLSLSGIPLHCILLSQN